MQLMTPKPAKLNPQNTEGQLQKIIGLFSSRLGTPTVLELEARKGIGLYSKIIAKMSGYL